MFSSDDVPFIFYVVSGLIMMTYNDDLGKQHVVSFAMEDWWENRYYAFFSQTKATYVDAMPLKILESWAFHFTVIVHYAPVCIKWNTFLEKANRGHIASQQRILSFLTSDAKDRYEKLLKRYPSLSHAYPKNVACFLLRRFRKR